MNLIRTARFALLVGIAPLAACNLEGSHRVRIPPQLRIVNAAPSTTGVNLHLNGAIGLLDLPLTYRQVSVGCPMVLSANHTMEFFQGETAIAATQVPVFDNFSYLVMLVEHAGVFRAVVIEDDVEATAGNNSLRIINATATAGDIYITAIGDAPSAANRVATNLAPLGSIASPTAPLLQIPETALHVRLYDTGTTTNPRSDLLITSTEARRMANIILTEKPFPSDPGGFQVNACP